MDNRVATLNGEIHMLPSMLFPTSLKTNEKNPHNINNAVTFYVK